LRARWIFLSCGIESKVENAGEKIGGKQGKTGQRSKATEKW
jgi:hypothetical protein